ncbi:MAG: hypothetical protein ACD_2C00211G0005 [uncultured bacterium (gcode 4)]|uniref:ART-PolyVal-like domain-containing protein n=1 Tax=uncultured bacterium (gcode 4) TaxID=1234023 RepID=K2FDL7_9BACT|nr:MAG: hypothetical protein ACD_2C00211G0005 [uncultured bacterium (gcode 4)]
MDVLGNDSHKPDQVKKASNWLESILWTAKSRAAIILSDNFQSEIWYHGTPKIFDNFDVSKMNADNWVSKTSVLFFTRDKDFANDYTKINDFSLDELNEMWLRPNVRPVKLSYKNAWDFKKPEHRQLLFEKVLLSKFWNDPQDMPEAVRMTNMMLEHGSWRWIEPQFNFIKDLWFDAILFTEQWKENIAIFDDSQIKSIFSN